MSAAAPEPLPPKTTAAPSLFGHTPPDRNAGSPVPWIVAAGVVILVLVVLLLSFRHKGAPTNAILPPDPYAANLVFTDLVPSESESLSGGKSTFLDGHVRNTGSKTLTGATLQVLFLNDEAMPPQVVTLPLTLVRTREPYIDTQMLSAAPLGPGEDREFRLIFENIHSNWNQAPPQLHLVSARFR